MQCTSEQIEEKRRQAQQKLAAKNSKSPIPPPHLTSNSNFHVQPAVKNIFSRDRGGSPNSKNFKFKPYEKPKNVLQFYNKKEPITGSVYLVSEERFAVDISEFSVPVVEVFKAIPSRSYSGCLCYCCFFV